MKRALCINSFEEISALIRGEAETIDSCFVAREICEDPNNKFLQVIPYVTFYTPNHAEGKIVFVQYKRAAQGSEDRLLSKTSIGFGGHIDQLTDITSTSAHTAEDTTEHFVMTKNDLVATCITAAKRELLEELGVDVLGTLGVELDFNEAAFFMGDTRDPVNQVHLGLSFPVKLTEAQFTNLLAIVNPSPSEIEVIDKMSVNIRHIVEEMDVSATNGKIMQQLIQQHNVEDWSVRVFDFIVRKEIFVILKDVDYNDLYRVAVAKQQARDAQESQRLVQEAEVERISNDAEAIHKALVPTFNVDNPDLAEECRSVVETEAIEVKPCNTEVDAD